MSALFSEINNTEVFGHAGSLTLGQVKMIKNHGQMQPYGRESLVIPIPIPILIEASLMAYAGF